MNSMQRFMHKLLGTGVEDVTPITRLASHDLEVRERADASLKRHAEIVSSFAQVDAAMRHPRQHR